MSFTRAERKRAKARIGICGPAGSGKTMSALKIAFGLGGKVALIDTEHGSGELYSSLGEYDVAAITPPYEVKKYISLLEEAEKAGYDTIIIDSLSHAWAGDGGLLDKVDKLSGNGNKFAAWRNVTPEHNRLIDAMLKSRCHIIATMRSKTEYVLEQNAQGKQVPRKIGLAPVQREGMDYEFTIVFDVEQERHVATTSKDRTSAFDGFCEVLSESHGEKIREWLDGGIEPPAAPIAKTMAEYAAEVEAIATVEGLKSWYTDNVHRCQKDLSAEEQKELLKVCADRKHLIEVPEAFPATRDGMFSCPDRGGEDVPSAYCSDGCDKREGCPAHA